MISVQLAFGIWQLLKYLTESNIGKPHVSIGLSIACNASPSLCARLLKLKEFHNYIITQLCTNCLTVAKYPLSSSS